MRDSRAPLQEASAGKYAEMLRLASPPLPAAGSAKVALVSLSSVRLGSGSPEASEAEAAGAGAGAPSCPSQSVQLSGVQLDLDPDALLCATGVADGVASLKDLLPQPLARRLSQQLQEQAPQVPAPTAGASGSASSHGAETDDAVDIASLNQQRSASDRGPDAAGLGQPPAAGGSSGGSGSRPFWALEWDSCSIALPLSAELTVGLQLGPAAGQWRGPAAASLALQSTALEINGGCLGKGVQDCQEAMAAWPCSCIGSR